MRNQSGFTLIEMVVVIVILGILAAIAVPKFADIQDDARRATVEGLYGAVKSATALGHAQALAEGKTAASGENMTMEGSTVDLVYGYPAATSTGITAALSAEGFVIAYTTGTPPTVTFTATGVAAGNVTTCRATYTEATDASTPASSAIDKSNCN